MLFLHLAILKQLKINFFHTPYNYILLIVPKYNVPKVSKNIVKKEECQFQSKKILAHIVEVDELNLSTIPYPNVQYHMDMYMEVSIDAKQAYIKKTTIHKKTSRYF